MVAGGKVVATVSGSDIDEFTASNPAVTVVLDTTDLERVIGMSYSKGKLSGLPSPDPVVPTVVPQSVTMRQARLVLLGAGLLPGVSAAIAGLSEPKKSAAQIEWEYANAVQRNSGLVPEMAAALGLTPAQIDALFIAAEKL